MSLDFNDLATWLLALGLLALPAQTAAQAPASDTSQVPPDSALDDSTAQSSSDSVTPQASSDSGRPQASRDTAGTGARATTGDTAAASKEPRDSILSAACSGPGGSSAVARDLLVVVFAPEAGTRERRAAAKTVKGKLLGPVSSEEPGGAYYVRVPSGGDEYRLRLAADHLVQLQQVRQVGSRACPSLPAPKKPL